MIEKHHAETVFQGLGRRDKGLPVALERHCLLHRGGRRGQRLLLHQLKLLRVRHRARPGGMRIHLAKQVRMWTQFSSMCCLFISQLARAQVLKCKMCAILEGLALISTLIPPHTEAPTSRCLRATRTAWRRASVPTTPSSPAWPPGPTTGPSSAPSASWADSCSPRDTSREVVKF